MNSPAHYAIDVHSLITRVLEGMQYGDLWVIDDDRPTWRRGRIPYMAFNAKLATTIDSETFFTRVEKVFVDMGFETRRENVSEECVHIRVSAGKESKHIIVVVRDTFVSVTTP